LSNHENVINKNSHEGQDGNKKNNQTLCCETYLKAEKLHQAIFNYTKAEHFCKRGNEDKSTKFCNLSNSRCEEALEILQEIAAADGSLQVWFGRALDFGKQY
jgi:hypothetical protein